METESAAPAEIRAAKKGLGVSSAHLSTQEALPDEYHWSVRRTDILVRTYSHQLPYLYRMRCIRTRPEFGVDVSDRNCGSFVRPSRPAFNAFVMQCRSGNGAWEPFENPNR